MRTYSATEWWHLDSPDDIHAVSFSNIHSRLYESEAVASYLPAKTNIHHATETEIEIGMESILQARTIAAATDERIADRDIHVNGEEERETAKGKWFWADCRADGLDVQSVNGVEVGGWDGEREPRVWRQVLGVVDGRREGVEGGFWRGEEGGSEDEDEEGEEDEEEEGGEGEGGEVEEEKEEDEGDDDTMELDPPEPTRTKKVEVKVNVPARM